MQRYYDIIDNMSKNLYEHIKTEFYLRAHKSKSLGRLMLAASAGDGVVDGYLQSHNYSNAWSIATLGAAAVGTALLGRNKRKLSDRLVLGIFNYTNITSHELNDEYVNKALEKCDISRWDNAYIVSTVTGVSTLMSHNSIGTESILGGVLVGLGMGMYGFHSSEIVDAHNSAQQMLDEIRIRTISGQADI